MTPRNDIVKIDISLSNREIGELIRKSPHTVYPVIDGSLDEILGTVSIEDLFGRLDEKDFSIKSAIKPSIILRRTQRFTTRLNRCASCA